MDLIIFAIIAGLIGLAFLSWGIYQIKTGKMVAKNRVFAVDEPREVGVIFMYLGILGLVLGVNFLLWGLDSFNAFSNETVHFPSVFAMVAIAVGMCGPLLLIIFGIYDLVKKRVFSIKTMPRTKKMIKKYYLAIGLSKIMVGILAPLGVILTFVAGVSNYVASALLIVAMVATIIMSTLMCRIEVAAKKRK